MKTEEIWFVCSHDLTYLIMHEPGRIERQFHFPNTFSQRHYFSTLAVSVHGRHYIDDSQTGRLPRLLL